jgi:hypothetical protein
MNKLFLFVTLLSIIHFNVFTQGCLPEGITFTTQEQIDNFQLNYPGCTEIEGDVSISGNEISNLNGLSVLTSIGGHLWIANNFNLTSLSGLENLLSIGGNISIINNNQLPNLIGLENIESIPGNLDISENDNLMFLNGLDYLTNIEGNLTIYDNPDLYCLTGLENLQTIGVNLHISNNLVLDNFLGLEQLDSVGGNFEVINNPYLNNLVALDLTSINGDLEITGNESLIGLTGLDNVSASSIVNLTITYNDLLTDCDVQSVCEYLGSPGGTIEIHDNATGCNSPEEVEEHCLTAQEENSTAEVLLLSPNPASSFITITTTNNQPVEEVIIYNHLGQKVLTAKPVNNTVNVSKLKAGLYLMEILSANRITRTKFLKD